ncbi:efflux RND transporter periplasmic adaptor subunit [Ruegeria litorea]|uniref:Efflux RND transporter periplasmic adaptor subunit n=1 Tax=Falsiruegeria litorea TaxID=1280831 RepID=A0ABS5WLS6_9RHOB|nr:efflux RND transporter periplasmic adaptor subunit [Falsiruegeria litorea]MBT3139711.1 efflux RND transporter periplasmic adaptor subunit [Falsiruegeria litorea]
MLKVLTYIGVVAAFCCTAAFANENALGTAEFGGIVVPAREAEVTPIVSAWLKSITFEPGQIVTKGDVLFEFHTAPADYRLQLAQGQLSVAEAKLLQAEAELKRTKTLKSKDVISESAVEIAEAARGIAAGNVEQAKATVGLAGLGVMQMTQKAPITGVISAPMVKENGWQDVTLSGGDGITMAIITQLDPIQVIGKVPYAVYANRQKLLKSDEAISEALVLSLVLPDGELYPHEGRLVSGGYKFDEVTQTLEVWGEFPNPDLFLRPGLKVTIRSRAANN